MGTALCAPPSRGRGAFKNDPEMEVGGRTIWGQAFPPPLPLGADQCDVATQAPSRVSLLPSDNDSLLLSLSLWSSLLPNPAPPCPRACLLSVEKLYSKNTLNQRSEKMQKQRKAGKQDQIIIV